MHRLILFLLLSSFSISSIIADPVSKPTQLSQSAKDWNKMKAGAKFASAAFVAMIAGLGFLILRTSTKSQKSSYSAILAGALMAVPSAILCVVAIKSGIDDLRAS